jgi:hypothetical protein
MYGAIARCNWGALRFGVGLGYEQITPVTGASSYVPTAFAFFERWPYWMMDPWTIVRSVYQRRNVQMLIVTVVKSE